MCVICVGPTATETDHSFKHMGAFSVRSQSAAEASNQTTGSLECKESFHSTV